ncbi:MAG: VWA domain-containing protein, partial [Bacteroidota bacterium]
LASAEASPKSASKPKPPSLEVLKDWLYGNKEREAKEVASYSTGQTHDKADLSVFSKEESTELLRLIRLITQALANRPLRRVLPQQKPGNLHLRQTMRESLRKGGDYIDLWYAHPKPLTVNIVLVCDVSKSMEIYSRFIIQLLWGFQSSHRQLETFVFSTQLARVTRHLKGRRLRDALQRLTDYVDDWSAGTRIGASLHTLATEYTHLINSKTVVIIMSDGWDTGEMPLLEEAMKALHKRAGKVIWINPLAKNAKEVPEVAGLQTAWPYIDLYAPAHDVEGLREVVTRLRKGR